MGTAHTKAHFRPVYHHNNIKLAKSQSFYLYTISQSSWKRNNTNSFTILFKILSIGYVCCFWLAYSCSPLYTTYNIKCKESTFSGFSLCWQTDRTALESERYTIRESQPSLWVVSRNDEQTAWESREEPAAKRQITLSLFRKLLTTWAIHYRGNEGTLFMGVFFCPFLKKKRCRCL